MKIIILLFICIQISCILSFNVDEQHDSQFLALNRKKKYTTVGFYDFHKGSGESGFGLEGLDGEWTYFQFGEFLADQAKLSKQSIKNQTSNGYLRIDSNPFTKTVKANLLDHLKFLALTKKTYSIPENGALRFKFRARAQIFGTENHPFGKLVSDHNSDYRLAMGVLNVLDLSKTMIVADFFLTNKQIYVLYERLPFARTETNNYASFSYAIPVADRKIQDFHNFSISFSKESKSIKWFIGDTPVFKVDKVGHHIPGHKENMFIDKGGEEDLVFPDDLAAGLGTMTVLDGTFPKTSAEIGLVRGSENMKEYFNPFKSSEYLKFFDEESLENNRIFGQGCIMDVQEIKILKREKQL